MHIFGFHAFERVCLCLGSGIYEIITRWKAQALLWLEWDSHVS